MTKPLNQEEIELRDRIAIEAMKAVIAARPEWINSSHTHSTIAEKAYSLADHMLAERNKDL